MSAPISGHNLWLSYRREDLHLLNVDATIWPPNFIKKRAVILCSPSVYGRYYRDCSYIQHHNPSATTTLNHG